MLKFPKGYGLGYAQKVLKGAEGFIFPTLVVGANVYTRERLKLNLLKQWDTYILFFPTSDAVFRVGVLYMSRTDNRVCLDIGESDSVDGALTRILRQPINLELESIELHPIAFRWLTKSVYRSNKVALKDILALEPIKKVA